MDRVSAYTEAVERELRGVEAVSVGAAKDCGECFACEPEAVFSWSSCDGCGSSLGGDRYPGHGLIDGTLYHFEFCVDCVQYIANGDEPEEWRPRPS